LLLRHLFKPFNRKGRKDFDRDIEKSSWSDSLVLTGLTMPALKAEGSTQKAREESMARVMEGQTHSAAGAQVCG